tara:strand:- start:2903 stop:3292 length:390 start_codon:yes stop_codon:yes gene_type:complete
MKDKLFLLIILLLSLAIGLMMPIVEGVCSNSSYVSGGTGSTGAPVKYRNSSEKEKACKVISDSENSTRLGDVTGLIVKLGGKINNTFDSSNKLKKRTDQLQKNSKSLQNLADGKDVDTSDACKQYPEAC